MRKKRIIIDGEVLIASHFSGIGHYTLEMLRAIDRQLPSCPDLSVDVLIYFKQIEKARAYGFKNMRLIPSPISLRISNGLKTHEKQPPLDLLFGHGIYVFPNFTSWPLIASKSVPVVYDLSYEIYPQYAEPRNQAFLSKQVKKSVRRASMVATISNNSRDEISEFYQFPTEKIGVYYPAVDTKRFYDRNADEVSSVKAKYGITGSYILFVGNIEPRKNLKNLLLAYEKLPDEISASTSLLLVGGKGWQDEEITETMQRLQSKGMSVQMPSHRVSDDDLPALYSGASVFVYPSIYEGFGIPPLEAMACGTPVVCADNSSLPEAVGDAALLVDASSVDDIAAKIASALTNQELRASLIGQGHRQVSKFSWDTSAIQLIADLRSL